MTATPTNGESHDLVLTRTPSEHEWVWAGMIYFCARCGDASNLTVPPVHGCSTLQKEKD